MSSASKIRLGVVGLGGMGTNHLKELAKMDVELAGVCDIDTARAEQTAATFGAPVFYDHLQLLDEVHPDAIIIATPHYDHTPISIHALQRGIHVLTEKPIAVHAKDARKMIGAYEDALPKYPDLKFAIMFQQRTFGFWQKIKYLIDSGQLGRLVRTTWIITDWFRSQMYYDHGGWRATWGGEGGGVLLNQCPHNLDLYQWLVGMPKRVTGFATLGKYHNIEVEDEVTGFFEHENGMVGHFITTTAESPGVNRLEIVGENGRLVFENGALTFHRNSVSMLDFIKNSPQLWDKAPCQTEEVPYEHHNQPGHGLVIANFLDSIRNGTPLIAPAPEGIRSLSLGNAILYSSFLKHSLDLPFDEDAYEAYLHELIRTSRFQKVVREVTYSPADLQKSFGLPPK